MRLVLPSRPLLPPSQPLLVGPCLCNVGIERTRLTFLRFLASQPARNAALPPWSLAGDVKGKAGIGQRNSADPSRWRWLAPCTHPWSEFDREGVENMSSLTRRGVLVGASALPLTAAGAARAQAKFPDRPIRLIIPWAAGGPADAGFRIMAQSVSKKLGQQVVVDNKAGASGIMGAIALQEAKPDGYTISQMHMSVLRQPLLNKQLNYHPINDLRSEERRVGKE